MKFQFSSTDRELGVEALFQYTNVTTLDNANRIIDDFELNGVDRSIGFGSLIKSPINSDSVETSVNGHVKDRVARYNSACCLYGGTYEKPSLMLGLENEEGGTTPGKITQDSLLDDNGGPDIHKWIENIRQFNVRESTPGHAILSVRVYGSLY